MFYTNIAIQGNTVLERYIDDAGVSRSRKVTFGPTMYKHSPQGEMKDIYGKRATAVEFNTISDCRKWMKDMRDINREPLGMDDFVLQYLYHTYSGPVSFNYEQIDIAFVDIEVPTDGPFPEPHICDWEIDGICHYSTRRKKYYLFTTRPWDVSKSMLDKDHKGLPCDLLDRVEYVFCSSEKELLVKYLKFFRDHTPDVFSGWNSEMFDLRYIVNRYRKVLGDVYANKLSPWDQIIERTIFKDKDSDEEEDEEIVTYELLGIACVDYMAAYKKFTFKTRPSYKLDYIGQVELGMRKMELTEKTYLAFSQKNPQAYIDYLIRDVDLLVKLDARLSLFHLILSVSYYAKINYNNTFSPLKTWDAIIHNSLHVQGIVVPENKRTSKKKYAGAYVKDPVTAFYRWILSFDLTSLYPHIIMGWNISPETIIDQFEMPSIFVKDRMVPDVFGTGLVDKKMQVPHNGHSFAANGMRYTREKRGIIPTEIEKVFLQRKAAKNAEFTADKIATVAYDILIGRKENGEADKPAFFDPKTIDLSMKGAALEQFKDDLLGYSNESLNGVVDYCRFMEKLENVNQQARKVLINSLYGALGNEHFRYYDVRNAEAITMSGQFAIRWIMRKMNEYMNALCQTENVDYVVYGDTDSIYLTFERFVNLMAAKKGIQVGDIETIRWVDFLSKFAKEKCEPYIDQSYRELAEYVNCFDHKLFMDREIIADTAFWTAKKRYAANVWDSEGKRKLDEHGNVVPKLKIMGIETQRSSTPVFAGKSLEKSIKLILTKGEAALQDYVAEVKAEYPKRDYRELASVSSANNIEKNHHNWVPLKGCPGHIKGALAYNKTAERLNCDMIRSGEKIQIVYLREPNHIQSPILAFPSGEKIPDDFNLDLDKYMDYMGMYQKHYLKPLENICNAIGWETEKKASLMDLFDF
ncbi:DNA polymerase [Aeromonas phage phiAS5]|uniref:DNA polymerase n=1 Tax=Aeromonas phage phiAS5 TaxID=879630 RepID=E1A2P1_9CAUD|nr:DNA polymerase [Aeromonas phage phiAS5]ADM79987.1 DNA polymerase [Aeromonas phage phiAS5]